MDLGHEKVQAPLELRGARGVDAPPRRESGKGFPRHGEGLVEGPELVEQHRPQVPVLR